MATYVCDIELSGDDVRAIYAGTLRYLQVRSREGLRLRFPASFLRGHVGHAGIRGTFEIVLDAANKLQSLRRVSGTHAAGRRPPS